MAFRDSATSGLRPYALALLRVATAYMFLLHGWMKFSGGAPLASLFGAAMVLELVGGVLLVLGLFVRPVAFILSGEMAFAYWMAHAKAANWWLPVQNHGESAALFCFIFLYLAVAGGGALALDDARRRR
ncbi:MAG: DoxX family protein [Burkholderiaceae bacterium]|jgi:putative oxidoreductase|nr:DoxX family protein [Pseudomonadota bacterium]MBS0598117.1 DoxX family protein [Pseudomonadota bacterium]MCO5116951.1 DoxX family protein [Burkholderiaceae bacterium]MCP5219672.1 DoxX family protein [Burkholderiaceae bacterium]